MPTLITNTTKESTIETARTSDLAWVNQELLHDESFSTNDSTISGTLIKSAFSQVQQRTPDQSKKGSPPDGNYTEDVQSLMSQHFTCSGSSLQFFTHCEISNEVQETTQLNQSFTTRGKFSSRITGHNERNYNEQFKEIVTRKIAESRKLYPDQLRDYRTLEPENKRREQERVRQLFVRLGINKEDSSSFERHSATSALSNVIVNNTLDTVDPDITIDPDINYHCEGTKTSEKDKVKENFRAAEESVELLSLTCESLPVENEHISAELLAPSSACASYHHQVTSMDMLSPFIDNINRMQISNSNPIFSADSDETIVKNDAVPPQDDGYSSESIEVPRAVKYESPYLLSRISDKRLATTSGKRGLDTNQIRPKCVDGFENDFKSSLNIFTSSQSPIEKDIEMFESLSNISISCTEESDQENQDSIEYTQYSKTLSESIGGFPTPLGLKKGNARYFQPIEMKSRSHAQMDAAFPDPLTKYGNGTKKCLQEIVQSIIDREASENPSLVLSVSLCHAVSLSLKLCLAKPVQSFGEPTSGQILIVGRTKGILSQLSSSFKEGSPYSVLNHATLSVKERTSHATSLRCSKFNIVLTTFDALKAPDVTLLLDKDDHVVCEVGSSSDCWFRGGSQREEGHRNVQLSVLHRLKWFRVIFIDEVGKSSYLCKGGTARSFAAKAINASLRLALFVCSKEDTTTGISTMEALLNTDKKALCSLLSALRVSFDEEYPGPSLLEDCAIDIKSGPVKIRS